MIHFDFFAIKLSFWKNFNYKNDFLILITKF